MYARFFIEFTFPLVISGDSGRQETCRKVDGKRKILIMKMKLELKQRYQSLLILRVMMRTFSQSLENLNKPSELRPTSNHPLFVSPTGSLPSPSPTILHNNVGQALTHNLHIQILEALCCLYEKTIILITPLLSLRIPLMTSICSSLSPQFPQNICSNYSLCSA